VVTHNTTLVAGFNFREKLLLIIEPATFRLVICGRIEGTQKGDIFPTLTTTFSVQTILYSHLRVSSVGRDVQLAVTPSIEIMAHLTVNE
jgi:hypothetical protein